MPSSRRFRRIAWFRCIAWCAACLCAGGLAPAQVQAQAQEKACLMEGSFTLAGVKTEIKDCLQNDGVAAAGFKETCNSLAQAPAAVGGAPARITWLAACPAQPQGICDGFFGQPMSSHYYKRDPKTMADVKAGCQAQGGKWR